MSSSTRYIEFQDGTYMTDGTFMDDTNTSFTELYGGGHPIPCFQLNQNSIIGECNDQGAVLCETTLFSDTHICLNKDFLASVSLNMSTELFVPTQVFFENTINKIYM